MVDFVDAGLLVLRVGFGLTLAAHGLQKLLGWWDGPGWAGWVANVQRMGVRPAKFWAGASLSAEVVGGVLLTLGWFTPLAAAVVVGPMLVVVFGAKWRKGFWNTKGGYEYPLILMLGALGIFGTGPGRISADYLMGLSVDRLVSVGFLGATVIGAAVAASLSRRAEA